MKKQLHATARIFQSEGNVSMDPSVIDAPSGFLLEWWTVFWDLFRAKCSQEHSEEAESYLMCQQIKAREMREQEEQEFLNPKQNQQIQMQLLPRHALQHQHGGGTQVVSGSASYPISNDSLMKQNQGPDPLRPGLILQKNSLMQSSQSFNQFSLRQQFLLQAQQNLVNPSASDSESKGSIGSTRIMKVDGSVSSTLKEYDQASGSQIGRKQKPASSPDSVNGSGSTNTAGPYAISPSMPSVQTPGDVMTEPTLQQNFPFSTSFFMFSPAGLGSPTSRLNRLADMDHRVGDDAADYRGRVGKGCPFKEVKHIMASSHKVECCDFSSDGKLFVTGGRDKKASLWCTESFNLKSTLEEHTRWITDVRFCPSMLRVATSSADKTVRVWDADNPGYSLRTFTGHATPVMSLDFHPSKDDLICSCAYREIRYWSVENGSCDGIIKVGVTQTRFQPRLGRLLAAVTDNHISIFDVETLDRRHRLKGHVNPVRSVCWDSSGKYLASLSDDLVKLWSSEGEFIHSLQAFPDKAKFLFHTCAFHPFYSVLLLGCHETLVLWDFGQRRVRTLPAHDKRVSALAVSNTTGLVASASHDKHFKIWIGIP